MDPTTRNDDSASMFSVDSAEAQLARTPTFNLLLVASSGKTIPLVPALLEGVFGVKNVRIKEGSPFKPKGNERITFHLAVSASNAREYIQSRGVYTPAEQIHAIWYLADGQESGSGAGIGPREQVQFGIQTLIVFLSKTPLDQAKFQQASIDLRLSGIESDLVGVDVSNHASLSQLSHRTEASLINQPELRLVWVAAQRVSGDEKIATAVSKGMKLFSVAVGASAQPLPFVGGATGVGVMTILQRDIVAVYNFEDPGHILLSKSLGNIFYEAATGLPIKWMTSLVGLSTVSGLWEAPATARNISQAIADLVLVLDAIFYTLAHKQRAASLLHHRHHRDTSTNDAVGTVEEAVTKEEVQAIIKLYEKGDSRRAKLHGAEQFRRDAVHAKLGTANIGRFDVWKSLKRKDAEKVLKETIAAHRYRGCD